MKKLKEDQLIKELEGLCDSHTYENSVPSEVLFYFRHYLFDWLDEFTGTARRNEYFLKRIATGDIDIGIRSILLQGDYVPSSPALMVCPPMGRIDLEHLSLELSSIDSSNFNSQILYTYSGRNSEKIKQLLGNLCKK